MNYYKKKKCNFCKKRLFLNNFGIDNRSSDGRQYTCNPCYAHIARLRRHGWIVLRERNKGKDCPHWKGGYIDKSGYRYFRIDSRKIAEHRYIMEQHLGRRLLKDEHVHHINENKLDNRLENLALLDNHSHPRLHAIKQWKLRRLHV